MNAWTNFFTQFIKDENSIFIHLLLLKKFISSCFKHLETPYLTFTIILILYFNLHLQIFNKLVIISFFLVPFVLIITRVEMNVTK